MGCKSHFVHRIDLSWSPDLMRSTQPFTPVLMPVEISGYVSFIPAGYTIVLGDIAGEADSTFVQPGGGIFPFFSQASPVQSNISVPTFLNGIDVRDAIDSPPTTIAT
jgi:hypothetical protein